MGLYSQDNFLDRVSTFAADSGIFEDIAAIVNDSGLRNEVAELADDSGLRLNEEGLYDYLPRSFSSSRNRAIFLF